MEGRCSSTQQNLSTATTGKILTHLGLFVGTFSAPTLIPSPRPKTVHPKAGYLPAQKKGIGIGVSLGGVLIIAILLWLLHRRRGQKSKDCVNVQSSPGLSEKPELPVSPRSIHGLSGFAKVNTEQKTTQHVVPAASITPELDGLRTPSRRELHAESAVRDTAHLNLDRINNPHVDPFVIKKGPLVTNHSFKSLVERSITAWNTLTYVGDSQIKDYKYTMLSSELRSFNSIDDLFQSSFMFYFFQRRESFLKQNRFLKWDLSRLDEYILLPVDDGFVNKKDCFFVSHYWRSREEPDPRGEDFRLVREDLSTQSWTYVWIDWTCLP